MKRILLEIEYLGTNYSGWQIQKNQITIEEKIEKVLFKLLNQKISLVASGRTDAGVHAIKQCAHFDFEGDFDIKKMPEAINASLPIDIRVKNAKYFTKHARFDVKKKTYLYKVYNSKISSPLRSGLYAQVKYDLNFEEMKKACEFFVGTHDFSAFCSANSQTNDFTRTIFSLELKKNKDELYFKISGNGFLYNMVRIIVGTIIDVGRGKLSASEIGKILESKDRSKAGKTMPACGLYLFDVKY